MSLNGEPLKISAWESLKGELRRGFALFDERCRRWVDAYREDQGGRIHCGRGCFGCCNLAVNCTLTEALLVAETLTPEQAGRLEAQVARLLEVSGKAVDFKSYLRLHRQEVGFCPFLHADGACGIYAVRPFSCRSLLSTRPGDWCAVDFAALPELEKTLFVGSLDRSVVAFPSHYVAATRDLGQELEAAAALRLEESFGVSLSGNLVYLVFLERRHGLSRLLDGKRQRLVSLLEEEGLSPPYLLQV